MVKRAIWVVSMIGVNWVFEWVVSVKSWCVSNKSFCRVCFKNDISISAIYQLFTGNGVMLLWLSLKGVDKKENTFQGRSQENYFVCGHWIPHQGLYQFDIHSPNSIKDIQSHVVTCMIVVIGCLVKAFINMTYTLQIPLKTYSHVQSCVWLGVVKYIEIV